MGNVVDFKGYIRTVLHRLVLRYFHTYHKHLIQFLERTALPLSPRQRGIVRKVGVQGFATTSLASPTVQAPAPCKSLLGYLFQSGKVFLQRLDNTFLYTLWHETFASSLSAETRVWHALVRKETGKEGWMAITCFDGERPSWTHEDYISKSTKLSAALAALHIDQVSCLSLAVTRIKSFCPFSFLVRGWELTGRNEVCIRSALQHPPAPAAVGGSPSAVTHENKGLDQWWSLEVFQKP